MNQARNLTPEDKEAARRLRGLWTARLTEARRRGERFTQEMAAETFGWAQSAVSQYLRGEIALGAAATLKFAQYLRCHPSEIRPEQYFQLSEIDDQALDFLAEFTQLAPEEKDLAIQVVRQFKKRPR